MRALWRAGGVVLLAAGVAEGRLIWDRTEVAVEAAFGQAELTAEFPFRNSGSTTIRLTEVHSGCGCTVPALDRTEVGPGESGVVRAAFKTGDRQGRQNNAIVVRTDDPDQPTVQLLFRVDIPLLLDIQPRVLAWPVGEPATPRTIRVAVHPASGAKLTAVQAKEDGFTAEVRAVDGDPHRYDVVVAPEPPLTGPRRAVFELVLDRPLARPGQNTFFTFVR